MNEHILLYSKTYKQLFDLGTDKIKKQLIDHKSVHSNFIHAHNTILLKFEDFKKERRLIKKPYDELYYLFKNRLDLLEEEYQYTIIPNALFQRFIELNNDESYSFSQFVVELASFNADAELLRIFRNYSSIYEMMYEVNNFDDFELIEYKQLPESVPLFKKYHEIIYGKKESLEETPFNFQILKGYKSNFERIYNMLTNDYIDEKKTTYADFCNVFFNDIGSHSSKIHFLCNTQSAAYLLYELCKNGVFKKFTQKNIEKSKSFISSESNILKQSNISHSSKKVTDDDYNYVSEIIKIIKNTSSKS